METYFKKFQYFYQKEKLEALLKKVIEEKKVIIKLPWVYAEADIVLKNQDILPMSHILKKNLTDKDFGLALMIGSTDFHINPKNNGLIIFPVSGTLKFNFKDKVEITIDTPTIVNGKITHKYFPVNGGAMFYAIKIPSDITWNEICSIVNDDR